MTVSVHLLSYPEPQDDLVEMGVIVPPSSATVEGCGLYVVSKDTLESWQNFESNFILAPHSAPPANKLVHCYARSHPYARLTHPTYTSDLCPLNGLLSSLMAATCT